ncbi:MAG TPA: DUF4349 domain-containing protein [Longimicrobium sp.]|nr:DUF4349 domain-containing protein [Longimicrobium sp.]
MPRLHRVVLLLPYVLATGCSGGDRAATTREDVADYQSPDISAGAPAPNAVSSGSATAPPKPADAAAPAERLPPTPAAADSAAPRMIIRTGTATLQVDKLEPAIARVQQMAQQMGGYVSNTSVQGGSQNVREATLELKLPSQRWDQAVAGLRPLGKLEALTTSTEDVGEEYVDVTARMNNARRLEQRLVELLATRTGKLEDVLAVERELARVREEIERYEGRLRFLRSRVALSTLTVKLHEPMPVIGGRPGGNPIIDAFREAWDNFVGFLAGLISMLGWLLPLLALAALVIWLFRRFVGWRPGSRATPGIGPRPGAPHTPPNGAPSADPNTGTGGPGTPPPPHN